MRARQELGLSQDTDIILFVSHYIKKNYWRDYNLLEKTVGRLSELLKGRFLKMLCLGEYGKTKRFQNAEISFIPYERDLNTLARFYQASDIYMHLAKADTFPNTILEAMSCGLPVIATGVGGIPELVEDNVNGFLIQSTDAQEIAEKAAQLLKDKNLRESFSRRSIEAARQRFDLNYQVQSYLGWYEEIIEEWGYLKDKI